MDEKIYSALSFDGVNDYVSIPSINPTDAITVSAWVKSSSSTGYSGVWQIVSKYSAYILGTSSTGSNNMCFITYDTTWRYGSCYSVPDPENWHHFVGTYDSLANEKKLYVDGVLRSTTNPSGLIRLDTGPIHIGHRECCSGYYFGGLIDEVRIYNRALADDEALQHYQGVYQYDPGDSSLVGHWKFDDEGGVALDSSGNGNNGILVNSPTWVTSFDNVNNVPSYWRVCSDGKNNDCDLDIDANDSGCDGELTSLDISAKYGASLENIISDNGDIYRSDIGTLKLISTAFDSTFGINAHSILWKAGGVSQTSNNCGASGYCEIGVGDFPVGTVIEYKSFASDTNNNSACDPVDCSSYYSFTVRDFECYDINTETNINGSCESGTGECCGGICDISFDDSNSNGYDVDCKVTGCNGESWEWIPEDDSTSCNTAASNLCSVFSVSGCETTGYSCSSGLCEYNPTDQKIDYCYDDYKFKDFGCDVGNCEGTDINCKISCDSDCCCSCGSYDLDEKVYSSLSFDGVDDYAIINPIGNFPTTEITAEFWMKSSDTTKDGTPVSYATSGNNNEFIIFDYGSFRPHIKGASVDTGISANDGSWHHIIVTWRSSDGQIKLYKDGDFQIYAGTLQPGVTLSQGGSLIVGQEQDSVGGGFQLSQAFLGFIDEIRVYNRALSEGEALQHYQGVYQNESGLVGHWKFDDAITTSTAIDSSGNGNDGTLVNGPTWMSSFNDSNKNSVPTYWQACTDNKDNDCNSQKDSSELTCDGEFDVLSIRAENKNGNIVGDGDVGKDRDTDKISLIATPVDFDSGVKKVTVYWIAGGVLGQKTCGYGEGDDSFEDDETCLAEIGSFDAGTIVEYNTQGFDNNNNSKCSPTNCISSSSFSVILSNIAPVISELKKQQNESYCHGLNSVSFLWTYYDEDAAPSTNTQDLYEIQIKKGSVSDDPTISGFFDSGLLLNVDKNSETHSYLYNSNDTENNQDFEYNSTYYWRVKVKDVKGAFSDWIVYDDSDDDDGNGYAKSFSTPLHKYPDADFDFLPNSPDFGEEVTITDGSTAYDSSGNSNTDLIGRWEWDFDGDMTIDKTINRTIEILNGDTTHVYLNPTINQYGIKLFVTDNDNFTCYKIKQINIATGEEYPRWNEIAPHN